MEAGGQFLVPTKGRGRSSSAAEGPKWLSNGVRSGGRYPILLIEEGKKSKKRKDQTKRQIGRGYAIANPRRGSLAIIEKSTVRFERMVLGLGSEHLPGSPTNYTRPLAVNYGGAEEACESSRLRCAKPFYDHHVHL